ncbi:neural cell adhesion molecule L1 [Pseudonaja textilis]|uniref:neural cell adhesion molecule L1 n=1 Tax=Pseudonaja textilis TaxID=8673 RepID=UPI000EA8E621|nr:neural cell adhesion molecule L1 [Pseudonaja textilis]
MASTPACLLMLWPLVLIFCDPAESIKFPEGLQQPPEFTIQPDKEIVLYPTDEIILKWEATGNPSVTYRWTKDGEQFDPEEVRGIKQLENSGTLIIHANNGNVPTRFNGLYRCYASNILGTAVSSESRIIVENAPQWPKEEVAPITAEEGTHTVLPCNPPTSADPPKIYWLNSKIEHITQDERVTVGQDGNLYFANVQMKDSQPDYICNAHFQGPRLIIQKEPIELKVIPTNTFSYQKPILIVPETTRKSYVALLGKPLILECIAAGLPTPTVEWIHLNRLNPSPGVTFENYNKTLCIPSVTEDDDGDYQCIARNEHGSIYHTYTVNVEAAPQWIKMPVSQIYGPGENVRLDCEVDGKPKPKVSWSINGIPLKDVMPDPRRKIQSGALIFSEVQPNDTAVIQCQAHNKHGSILANAYILVVWLPAEILTPDGIEYAVVENQIVILHCKTFGAPRPKVQWFMEDMNPALKDERIFIFTNGSLKLQEVRQEDAGNFTCLAENDQNNVSITAHLVVKRATQIEEGPINMEKKQGESVTFYCKVLFDESIPKRGIQWRLDGEDIEESDNNNKYIIGDMSLKVTNVDFSDQGTYSCLAWTTLDSVEKSANLLVYGKPGPVSNLELQRQQNHEVKLTWTPGDDHNREIKEYNVFCEETKFGPEQMEWLATVPGNQPWAILHLAPFRSYNFYVQASNDQGKSELSSRSASYATDPAAPERNPTDVRGEGNETTNMIITWTPLPHKEWNAPMIKYHVQWRLENEGQWDEVEIEDPPVLVTDTPVFSPYEIKVQAVNDFGKGPEPESKKGYSGEDVPEAVPEDLLIEMINSTTIKLSWILPDKEKILGHLKGFKVYYSRLGTLAERSRRQAHLHFHPHGELLILGNVSEVILGGLRPWSRYQVQLAVLNGRGEGPRSEAMEFVTPEGVPSIPESFQLNSLSDTAVLLEWMPPKYPNGRLLRYVLGYQQANQTEMDIGDIHIPATQLSLNLSDLDPHIPYKFSLWAETKEGQGEISLLEEHNMHQSVSLSFINISVGETGENFTTIIWIPRQNQRDVEFAVHLMSKTDKGPWLDVGKGSSAQGSHIISDLQPGKQYRVRLVKVHRTGDVQVIWESDVETSGVVQERQKSFAAEGWFIGFISAIVLLILVLVLLCFIKRSKGGKYSVKDKEDTQVDSEARPMKDETFGEYRSLESDNEEKPFTSSQPSLNGDIKALGSDDSLADYGGSVDVQFNEDGSFIGQYSGQKGKEGGGNDSSGATSPTNVVAALE